MVEPATSSPLPRDEDDPTTTRDESTEQDAPFAPQPRATQALILGIKIILVVLIAYVLFQIFRGVDWSEVGGAVGRLSAIQFVVLFVLLVIRQVLNSMPLAVFAPGLSLRQSVSNDLSANLTATVAPPPGDVVLRVAMFRSWNVPLETGIAALSLNTLIYYVLRFTVPFVGFVALLLLVRFDESYAIVAVGSALIAILMGGVLLLVVRAEKSARWIGRTCARLVRRVRPTGVDEEAWADKMAHFRVSVEGQMRSGWYKALLALIGMVLIEALMILAALRFLGIDSDQLNAVEIIAAFCVTYPLTALPFSGLGVLDAVLYGILIKVGTGIDGPMLVAGLVIWRVFTLIIPLLLGGLTLLVWRRKNPDAEEDAAEEITDSTYETTPASDSN